MTPFSALILAGERGGLDPVAQAAGVSAKALAQVDGCTMLERVVAAVRAAGARRIAVATANEEVVAIARALECEIVSAAAGPSESAARGFASLGAPMLLTTADHALLQAGWITDFLADRKPESDVSILLARRDLIEQAVPETRRTYLRFADGEWSGCNLFYFASAGAERAFGQWQMVERNRKKPWRIVRRLGPGLLLRYLFGRLDLNDALARLGGRFDLSVEAVASRHGLAAVDVDKPGDLDLARKLAPQLGPVSPGIDV